MKILFSYLSNMKQIKYYNYAARIDEKLRKPLKELSEKHSRMSINDILNIALEIYLKGNNEILKNKVK